MRDVLRSSLPLGLSRDLTENHAFWVDGRIEEYGLQRRVVFSVASWSAQIIWARAFTGRGGDVGLWPHGDRRARRVGSSLVDIRDLPRQYCRKRRA